MERMKAADPLVCPDCDAKGDYADFPELVCDGCGGQVVTLAQKARLDAKAKSVISRNTSQARKFESFMDQLETDF